MKVLGMVASGIISWLELLAITMSLQYLVKGSKQTNNIRDSFLEIFNKLLLSVLGLPVTISSVLYLQKQHKLSQCK